jgi:hypothetical protein
MIKPGKCIDDLYWDAYRGVFHNIRYNLSYITMANLMWDNLEFYIWPLRDEIPALNYTCIIWRHADHEFKALNKLNL